MREKHETTNCNGGNVFDRCVRYSDNFCRSSRRTAAYRTNHEDTQEGRRQKPARILLSALLATLPTIPALLPTVLPTVLPALLPANLLAPTVALSPDPILVTAIHLQYSDHYYH